MSKYSSSCQNCEGCDICVTHNIVNINRQIQVLHTIYHNDSDYCITVQTDTVLPGALASETARQGNEGERERPKESELGRSCDRRPWLQLMCCALEVLLGAGASRDRRTGRGTR